VNNTEVTEEALAYYRNVLGISRAKRISENAQTPQQTTVAADDFLFNMLKWTEYRDLRGSIGLLMMERITVAIQANDLAFFVKLGRVLSSPPRSVQARLRSDKLNMFLLTIRDVPIGFKDGRALRLNDLTDAEITDYVSRFYKHGTWTEAQIRKARQRLGLAKS
jgi:hypothetical protein